MSDHRSPRHGAGPGRILSGLAALAVAFAGAVHAGPAVQYIVDVRLSSPEVARELQADGFDVAGINRKDSTAGVVATEDDLVRLGELGYEFTIRESREPGVGVAALQDYTDPQEIAALLDQVEAAHPTLARKVILQDLLFEGQVQYAMHITRDVDLDNDRPAFILDAQHHAREVMTPEIAMDMIDYLTSNYATDPDVQRWVDNINIWVVPSVNPDGGMHVFQSDTGWRKNRHPSCAVDNNRNYSFAWGSCNGSSTDCAAADFRGLNPISEPETQGMVQLVADVRPFLTLSYHTYGEYIMYPYGCSDPDERAAFHDVAAALNAILQDDNGQVGQYTVGPIWSAIYLVDGGSIDTQYAEYGAYGFTIEANCCSFQPDYATWRNVTVQRQRVAWRFFLDRTLDTPQIRGRITDAVTGVPIPATLAVQEITFTHGESPRRADARGNYRLLARDGQTYHVDYSAPGYCATSRAVAVGSGPSTVDVAMVPPTPPDDVAAAGSGDNAIRVTWSPAIDAVEYRVLRSLTSGGPYAEVGVVPAPDTEFVDTTVSGGAIYYYVVRAMQPCDSGNSQEASASTGGACFVGPEFAGLASASNAATTSCAVDLDWPHAASRCGGSVAYEVYRSPTAPFVPSAVNRIASGLTASRYVDHAALADGSIYFYTVRAFDGANGADDGNTVARSATPTGPSVVGTWTDDAGDTSPAQLTGAAPWSVHATGGKTGPRVYATGTYPNNACAALTSPVLSLRTVPTLTFASKHDLESGWDAGVVEIAEGPTFATWTKLTTVNYPDSLSSTGNACGLPTSGPGTVFSRNHVPPSYPATGYAASLAAYAGKDIRLRWRISSDVTGAGTGWWIDDIAVSDTVYWETCASVPGPVPTEVSPAGAAPMTADRAADGTAVDLTFAPACGAVSDAVYWGSGPISGGLAWTDATCALGNNGSASFDPGDPPPGGFFYFVLVGQGAASEGSYGTAFDGVAHVERPEAIGPGACDLPRDLSGVCP